MTLIGHVSELWRYPVKSMQGEVCVSILVDGEGVSGDRRFAFESSDAPVGKPLLKSYQRTAMLRARAETNETHAVIVQAADRRAHAVEDPGLVSAFESDLPGADLRLLQSERAFTDVRPLALHSADTVQALAQALGSFDGRRLRSNIILDLGGGQPFTEDALTGRGLQIGEAVQLLVLERIPRCRMVSLHPETATAQPSILRWLAQNRQGRVGIYARALIPGRVALGDPVWRLE